MSHPEHPDVDEWISRLDLTPHPEGGYFRETYRAPRMVTPAGASTPVRSASTAIYYMLTRGQFSALHRIRSDEVWHFYAGDSLIVTALIPGATGLDAGLETYRLGRN